MASVSRWNPSPLLHADPDLLFFFLVFQKLVFFTFLTCFFLPFLPPSSLFLPGPQRGSSASDQCVRNLVDFNLLWRAAVRNDCISTWLFFFSFLNPGHVLIREKLLLALFFFSSLNQGNQKTFDKCCSDSFLFIISIKIAMCPLVCRTIKVPMLPSSQNDEWKRRQKIFHVRPTFFFFLFFWPLTIWSITGSTSKNVMYSHTHTHMFKAWRTNVSDYQTFKRSQSAQSNHSANRLASFVQSHRSSVRSARCFYPPGWQKINSWKK